MPFPKIGIHFDAFSNPDPEGSGCHGVASIQYCNGFADVIIRKWIG